MPINSAVPAGPEPAGTAFVLVPRPAYLAIIDPLGSDVTYGEGF
jgi:hypothetical protein